MVYNGHTSGDLYTFLYNLNLNLELLNFFKFMFHLHRVELTHIQQIEALQYATDNPKKRYNMPRTDSPWSSSGDLCTFFIFQSTI